MLESQKSKNNKRASETTADELKANSFPTPKSPDSSARNVRQHIDDARSPSPPSIALVAASASSTAAAPASSTPHRPEFIFRNDLKQAGTYITAADISMFPAKPQSHLRENLLEIWNKLLDLPHFRETFNFRLHLISFTMNISIYVPEIGFAVTDAVLQNMTGLSIYFTGPMGSQSGICNNASITKVMRVGRSQTLQQTAWLPDAQAALFTILNILKTHGLVQNKFYETHAPTFQLNITDGQKPILVKRDVSQLSIDELKQELARRELFENEKKRCDTYKQDMTANNSYYQFVLKNTTQFIKSLTDSEIPTDVRVIGGESEKYEQLLLKLAAERDEVALSEIYANGLKDLNATRDHTLVFVNNFIGHGINNYHSTIKQQGATLVAETEAEIKTALNTLQKIEVCLRHNHMLAQIITIKRTLRALRARGSGTVADVIQKKNVATSNPSQDGTSPIEGSVDVAVAAAEAAVAKKFINEKSI
jgi:hypothetical protein